MEEKIFNAKTLNEAITNACVELGVPSDMLEYTVKQTGTNGFFGIGAKPYVISAKIRSSSDETVKEMPAAEDKKEAAAAAPDLRKEQPERSEKQEMPSETSERRPEKREKPERTQKTDKKERQPERPRKQDRGSTAKEPAVVKEEKKPERRPERPAEDPTPKAEAFLTSLFESMDMQISCKAEFRPENNELDIELSGEDMGVLIGKRGQTLDALQYLTSQVINKHQNTYTRVKLDTENYRERRKETLETLALNIAHKVRRNHRPVALEPMNPYERRIIHSILQNEKDVTTRSEGEEPYRHVIVCPVRRKKQGGRNNQKSDASKKNVSKEENIQIDEKEAPVLTNADSINTAETIINESAAADIPKDLLPENVTISDNQ